MVLTKCAVVACLWALALGSQAEDCYGGKDECADVQLSKTSLLQHRNEVEQKPVGRLEPGHPHKVAPPPTTPTTSTSTTTTTTTTTTTPLNCPNTVAISAFDYFNPQSWAGLCQTGQNQSPIDIETELLTLTQSSSLTTSYGPVSDLDWSDNGHAIEVDAEGTGSLGSIQITFAGQPGPVGYNVAQFHFHTESEHTINGVHFDGEMHIVHSLNAATVPPGASPAAKAVVGLLLSASPDVADNPCFEGVLSTPEPTPGCGLALDSFDLSCFNAQLNASFYSYSGSLTTPPCTEGVAWFVMGTPVQISLAQLAALQSALGSLGPTGNNRPTQPLNGRPVYSTCLSPVAVSAFDYSNPGSWPGLCQTGQQQSPIDIKKDFLAPGGSQVMTNYGATTDLDRSDNGHAIEVDTESGSMGTIQVNYLGQPGLAGYTVAQFHFHTESEHTLDGSHFDAEMHIVHSLNPASVLPGANPPAKAVVGLFIQADPDADDNPCFTSVLTEPMPATGCGFALESFDLSCLAPQLSGPYYSYSGSLTTPPCTEGVGWFVMATPVVISSAQLASLKAVLSGLGPTGNNRPTQPLDGRTVFITGQ